MAQILLNGGPLDGQWVKPNADDWTTVEQDGCVYNWDGEKYAYAGGDEVKTRAKRRTRLECGCLGECAGHAEAAAEPSVEVD